MHHLRSEFQIFGLDPRLAYESVRNLTSEMGGCSWILNPSVQWDESAQTVRVTFESVVENDSPVEPPILLQKRQLEDCLFACTESVPLCRLEDSFVVEL